MQIIIIGAGQLGSRHLQALCLSKSLLNVDVVDPSSESLDICRARFEEVAHGNISATFMQALPSGKSYDIAIIATASRVRAKVTEDILTTCQVNYIIFEKVLFTLIEDYAHIQKLLAKHNVKAWVNCPRRMYEIYQKLLPFFKNTPINLTVQGGDWGLACNSIHYVDLVAYLSGERHFTYVNTLLDNVIHDSKRSGYKEFTGSLIGKGEQGSTLVLTSRHNTTAPCYVQILGNEAQAIIDETNNKCTLHTAINQWKPQEIQFRIPYQSELTGLLVDELLQTGTCPLTPFDDSCTLHLPILDVFIKHQSEQGFSTIECPIT